MRIALICLILGCLTLVACGQKNIINYVEINGQKIEVEIADTPEKQRQGLSGRENLEENNGMLFIFPDKKQRMFWMKDMKFSLDIIWLQDDKIVEITENLPLPSGENIPSYTSQNKVNKVLEVQAGLVEKYNIKVGDWVLWE